MPRRVLLTGRAGFIGSHVATALLSEGHNVRVLDKLLPQVHGEAERPANLPADVEFIPADIRDAAALSHALERVDWVVHLAATVGVGQSMYEIARYTSINEFGTAVLIEALAQRHIERFVCASSMSIYGEGLAERRDGTRVENSGRNFEQLKRGDWNVRSQDGMAFRR